MTTISFLQNLFWTRVKENRKDMLRVVVDTNTIVAVWHGAQEAGEPS